MKILIKRILAFTISLLVVFVSAIPSVVYAGYEPIERHEDDLMRWGATILRDHNIGSMGVNAIKAIDDVAKAQGLPGKAQVIAETFDKVFDHIAVDYTGFYDAFQNTFYNQTPKVKRNWEVAFDLFSNNNVTFAPSVANELNLSAFVEATLNKNNFKFDNTAGNFNSGNANYYNGFEEMTRSQLQDTLRYGQGLWLDSFPEFDSVPDRYDLHRSSQLETISQNYGYFNFISLPLTQFSSFTFAPFRNMGYLIIPTEDRPLSLSDLGKHNSTSLSVTFRGSASLKGQSYTYYEKPGSILALTTDGKSTGNDSIGFLTRWQIIYGKFLGQFDSSLFNMRNIKLADDNTIIYNTTLNNIYRNNDNRIYNTANNYYDKTNNTYNTFNDIYAPAYNTNNVFNYGDGKTEAANITNEEHNTYLSDFGNVYKEIIKNYAYYGSIYGDTNNTSYVGGNILNEGNIHNYITNITNVTELPASPVPPDPVDPVDPTDPVDPSYPPELDEGWLDKILAFLKWLLIPSDDFFQKNLDKVMNAFTAKMPYTEQLKIFEQLTTVGGVQYSSMADLANITPVSGRSLYMTAFGAGNDHELSDFEIEIFGVRGVILDAGILNEAAKTVKPWIRATFQLWMAFYNINEIYLLIRGTRLFSSSKKVDDGGG